MINLSLLEQNFKTLIIAQCKFCKFDEFLEQNPDFEFPKITPALFGWENAQHITIPGLFGGFSYFLEEVGGKPILYAEQSNRMDHDSDDYLYFEITESGTRTLKGKEREAIAQKFSAQSKQAFKEHLRKVKTTRSEYESSQRK